ncbi:MAG: NADH:flavin oxidoreductase, partial [Bacteroidales bacterium]|nr:NADH:flavin oxidoreductase [Bacteroidales bacterium]
SVNRSGVSFNGQLWIREEIIPELKRLTDAIHEQGAKAAIQLGHCGNMTHRTTCGQKPVGASNGFNLYSPTFYRKLTEKEIETLVEDFGKAVNLVRQAGFDCVEIHAGHGYLISQFLSPYTNKRKDKFGGSLDNRMRFMRMVLQKVMKAAGNDMGVVVKTNMYDGFRGGLGINDCITVAQEIEKMGVHAIVLSAGFVSRAPMAVMCGSMPYKTLAYYMDIKKFWWLKIGIRLFGWMIIPPVKYEDVYFLNDAKKFRKAVNLPLIYVGGVNSRSNMEKVLNEGFFAVQMGRSLVHNPAFVNKIAEGAEESGCKHSNYCIGRMYTTDMKCHHCVENLPKKIEKEIAKSEKNSKIQ